MSPPTRRSSSTASPPPANGRQERPRPRVAGNEERTRLLQELHNPALTPRQACLLLEVTPPTLREYCRTGKLPCELTPGGHRRIRFRDLLALMADIKSRRAARRNTAHRSSASRPAAGRSPAGPPTAAGRSPSRSYPQRPPSAR